MKRKLLYLLVICSILLVSVSCGKEKYIGTYALNDKSFDSLKETVVKMTTDLVGADGYEDYIEMIAEVTFGEVMQEIGDMRITFKEDGSVEYTVSGETVSTTSFEIAKTRDLYVNGIYLGNFSEDYQMLTCKIEGIEFLLFKID